jgi:hypothetical protein
MGEKHSDRWVTVEQMESGDWSEWVKPAPLSAVGVGAKAVPDSGTAEPLAASATPCDMLYLYADGGAVYLDSGTASGTANANRYKLAAGDKLVLPVDDVSKIYVAQEGTATITVRYLYGRA